MEEMINENPPIRVIGFFGVRMVRNRQETWVIGAWDEIAVWERWGEAEGALPLS